MTTQRKARLHIGPIKDREFEDLLRRAGLLKVEKKESLERGVAAARPRRSGSEMNRFYGLSPSVHKIE
jgi:hypothetical protein